MIKTDCVKAGRKDHIISLIRNEVRDENRQPVWHSVVGIINDTIGDRVWYPIYATLCQSKIKEPLK